MSKSSDNESFVRELQQHLGIADDGWAGAITREAWRTSAGLSDPPPPAQPTPSTPTIPAASVDARSAQNIATLLPAVRPHFEAIVTNGTRIAREMGADAYVMIGGTRTYAEQNALYAKGRTAPGPVVTNARGGYSNHNFGVAGDFGAFAGSNYLDSTNGALASKIHKSVAAWVKANLPQIEWGGDWTSFRDEPHFQYKTGLSTSQMRERVAAGKSVV